MRIHLIVLSLLFVFNASAVDDKMMKELFSKYGAVMDLKKVELLDEVFSQKFIKESGGKEELISKIKELSTTENKSLKSKSEMSWRKGLKGEIYFAKVKETISVSNNKKSITHEAEFIVVKEDGKLKIEGTLSDGN